MGEPLGLCGTDLGKACFQYLRNVLMVLLTGAAQQRLIGGILDQGMLKEIRR